MGPKIASVTESQAPPHQSSCPTAVTVPGNVRAWGGPQQFPWPQNTQTITSPSPLVQPPCDSWDTHTATEMAALSKTNAILNSLSLSSKHLPLQKGRGRPTLTTQRVSVTNGRDYRRKPLMSASGSQVRRLPSHANYCPLDRRASNHTA